MEPVEIDIRLQQNVGEEGSKATKAMTNLGEESKRVQKELSENIAIQKKVISDLKTELVALEKDFKKVNVASSDPKVNAEKRNLATSVKYLRNEINLEEAALKNLEKTYTSTTNKSQNLETEIRNVRNEMAALKMQGQDNTQEYKILEERLGMLGTAYKELTATQKALSTGGTQMAGVLSGLNAVSGAFTAAAGAMGLVNNNSKDMEKIQTRLQSMMAITIGLQQISNTLHKTSAFRITTVTKVKELWAIANAKVAATLGLTNVQAQILMGTLTLGLSVAITAVVVLLDRYISKKREAAEAEQKFNDTVADTAATSIANYEQLRTSYNKLGNDLKAKKQFILENQDAFNDLGISVLNVNDADNAFINNTETMRQAFEERAKAAAYAEIQIEKYKEQMKLQLELEKLPKKVNSYIPSFSTSYGVGSEANSVKKDNPEIAEKNKQIAEIDKELETISTKIIESKDKLTKLFNDAQIKQLSDLKEYSKAWWSLKKELLEAEKAKLTTNDVGTTTWKELTAEIDKADKALAKFKTKKTPTTENNKTAKDLTKLQTEIEDDINSAVLAAMEKGKVKELLQLEIAHKQRIAKIKAQRKELLELEKQLGIKSPETQKKLDDLEVQENKSYKASKDAVNKAFEIEAQKQWDKLLEQYQTYEDKKTEILKRYAEERLKIEAKNSDGKLDGNLKELDKAKAKELFELEKSAGNIKSTIAEIFSDLSGKSTAELDKILEKAKAVLAFLQSGNYTAEQGAAFGIDEATFNSLKNDPKALAAISKLVLKLTDQTKTLSEHFETLFKKGVGQDEFEKSLSAISAKVSAAITLTQLFADTLSSIAELTGSDALGEVAESFSAIADVANSTLQGAQAGAAFGPAGAAIGAGLGLVSSVMGKIAASEKAHKEALMKIRQAEIAQMREYNALLFEQKLLMEDEESIFGVNAITKALGYLEAYNQTFKELQDKLTKRRNIYDFGWFSFEKFESELDKILIKTGHEKTGLFGWGKGRDIFSSITDEFPDLIKANGEFNVELAQSILSSSEFKNTHKETLEEIIALYEQTQTAQEEFNNYLSETFGSLGDGLVDGVINALITGEDAFESFAKNVGDVIGNLGKQIMYELFVSSRFKDFQDQLREIYDSGLSPEDTAKSVRDAISEFAQNMRGDIGAMQEFAQQWQEQTKDLGFDVWGNDEKTRSAASQGFAQASQDSIDSLLGRVYALVQFVNDIKLIGDSSLTLENESISIQTAMLGQLETIAANTGYNKHLKDIMDDLREMRERGIKIKA
jgi:hypothetical protein